MKVTKQRALKMLRKIGSGHLVAEAERTLPDPIDTERDGHLLARTTWFGLSERVGDLSISGAATRPRLYRVGPVPRYEEICVQRHKLCRVQSNGDEYGR